MSFSEAIATQPDWIRLWVLWMTIVMISVPLILMSQRASRRDGLIVLLSSLAVIISMYALFEAVGYTRLLGLPHVVIWTPLLIFLIVRLRAGGQSAIARGALMVLAATISVSLIFDYTDVLRYALGERGSLIPDLPA